MRCSCGAFIKASQKRCKACAVSFARGIDTDRFDKVVEVVREVESIMESEPAPKQETTKVKFNPNKLQYIPRKDIDRAIKAHRRKFWMRFVVGFLIALVIGLMALFCLCGNAWSG